MSKRARSNVPQFRVRVPVRVADELRGKRVLFSISNPDDNPCIKVVTLGVEVAFSLETMVPAIAAAREANALDHLRRLVDMTEGETVSLSHKDMVALSGETYRLYNEIHGDNPGEPSSWAYHKGLHRAALEGRIKSPPAAALMPNEAASAIELFGTGDLTEAINTLPAGQYDSLDSRFGLLADWVLIRHRIKLSSEDRRRFLRFIGTAVLDAGWQLRRNAEHDYSDDPRAKRFPSIETVTAIKPKQTITGLFDLWWEEAKATGRSDSTRSAYKNAIDRLVKHLGHDDAGRISEQDMLAFKDARLRVVTTKTLKDGDLPGIKSVLAWAVDNRKLVKNPADVVKVKSQKKIQTRPKGFTDQEASAVFNACLAYVRAAKEHPRTAAAKRWAPLIAAYTGCRIAEALQLRKEDIREESGSYIFDLNPLAGSIKTGVYRLVPIHSHLIELGLLRFISESDDGRLFAKGSYKRVLDFVRTVVTDERIQPNHAWRHRLKSISRDLGFDPRIVDAIQGHAARTSGEDYGDVSVLAMARVINAIPRPLPGGDSNEPRVATACSGAQSVVLNTQLVLDE